MRKLRTSVRSRCVVATPASSRPERRNLGFIMCRGLSGLPASAHRFAGRWAFSAAEARERDAVTAVVYEVKSGSRASIPVSWRAGIRRGCRRAGAAAAPGRGWSRPSVGRAQRVSVHQGSGERRREVDSFRRRQFRSYPLREINPGSFQVSTNRCASISCSKVMPTRCARTRSSRECPHFSWANIHAEPSRQR